MQQVEILLVPRSVLFVDEAVDGLLHQVERRTECRYGLAYLVEQVVYVGTLLPFQYFYNGSLHYDVSVFLSIY